MSGSTVRLSCAVAPLLLLLLLGQLRQGECLKCYESSCLKDFTKKSLLCRDELVSDMALIDCTPNSFGQRWKELPPVPVSEEMKCIKLEGKGKLPKATVGVDIVRMCAPKMQGMCDVLSTVVSTRIEHSDVQDLKLKFDCEVCDTDGCNSAPSHMISSLVIFAVIGISALMTNLTL